ncbi:hypothetical protein [Agrobacterium larrymoorei]|uniref:DUF4145 domain-containing protein n=1 Tax=Agrobacterium larrymoorei TaxID=160699 RepID=A0A4D7DZ02_9HYPH|nr:hypothetical protein [Agrobacterium larrymoorei]QCI97020.1 hypothetical protein CFBP5473_03275 [Agrobacterium larrymoorei]QYA07551.1 hypothetical protein J5285_02120 [Agrobacterium larrymoorei]
MKSDKVKATENALKFIGNNPSFDIAEFIDRISIKEDWAKIVVAHIYLDHIVTSLLKSKLPHPDEYLDKRGFSEKLVLSQSMGYLRGDFGIVLRKINTSRNKFAHELSFDVSDAEKRDLFRTLTTERPISDVTQAGGFEEFLITVVIFAEVSRVAEQRRGEISEEQNYVTGKIMEILIAQKGKYGSEE